MNNVLTNCGRPPNRCRPLKRFLGEGIAILILTLIISLVFSSASPTGIIMLKKAFGIRADASGGGTGSTTLDMPAVHR